jgi:hypothetical protein
MGQPFPLNPPSSGGRTTEGRYSGGQGDFSGKDKKAESWSFPFKELTKRQGNFARPMKAIVAKISAKRTSHGDPNLWKKELNKRATYNNLE